MSSSSAFDTSTFNLDTIGTEGNSEFAVNMNDSKEGNYYTNLLNSLGGGSTNVSKYNSMTASSSEFDMNTTVSALNSLNINTNLMFGGAADDSDFSFNPESTLDPESIVDTTKENNTFDMLNMTGGANIKNDVDTDSSAMSFGSADMETMTMHNDEHDEHNIEHNTHNDMNMTGGADNSTHISMTQIIADACKAGYGEILDFIFSNYRFQPDFAYETKDYDNIYHILCNCSTKSKGAYMALKYMLEKNMGKYALNKKNYNGDTPLHCAARNGLDEIVSLMVANGAKRVENNNGDILVTEYDSNVESEKPVENKIPSMTGNPTADLVIGTVGTILSSEENREKIKNGTQDIIELIKTKYNDVNTTDNEFTMNDTNTLDNDNNVNDVNNNEKSNNDVYDRNTESIVDNIRRKLRDAIGFDMKVNESNGNNQTGGSVRQMTLVGNRKMQTYSEMYDDFDTNFIGGDNKSQNKLEKVTEDFANTRDELHKKIIPTIKTVLEDKDIDYDEDDLPVIKAILYKEAGKDANGVEKAEKTLQMITEDNLKKILDNKEKMEEVRDEMNQKGGEYSDYDDYSEYDVYSEEDYSDYDYSESSSE